ncbi:hypothetical protein AB0M10_33055 [Streptomyces sp. NPDC051840]|uniref:hypothetical protein n=1 Tax=Streptomyces sp. NPDC051840 TaxID=3154752 RepID=UPI00343A8D74
MHVSAEDLRGEAPVALRDSSTSYNLAIDFSYPPEQIAEALTGVFQEAVDSHRWNRATGNGQVRPDSEPPSSPTGHPNDGY